MAELVQETETVVVNYFLLVTLGGASGEQEWGPFSKGTAEAVSASLGTRSDVQKVRVDRRIV